jgi:t-SNARE complex subunit (syntaxin)
MSWPHDGRDRRDSGSYSKVPTSESGDANDTFLNGQLSQLREQRREQDANLNILGESVTRLGQLSLSISEEMDSQNVMLDELGEEVSAAQETADVLTKKTAELVKLSGGPRQFCAILILSAVLFILVLLVVYT